MHVDVDVDKDVDVDIDIYPTALYNLISLFNYNRKTVCLLVVPLLSTNTHTHTHTHIYITYI